MNYERGKRGLDNKFAAGRIWLSIWEPKALRIEGFFRTIEFIEIHESGNQSGL